MKIAGRIALCAACAAAGGFRQASAADATMAGMVVYQADTATFTECATGRRLRVAQEAGYRDLERAYAQQRSAPGAALFVTVQGSVDDRPTTEGGAGPMAVLIVQKLLSLDKTHQCGERSGDLQGKWVLTTIGPDPVRLSRPAYLEFAAATARISGFGGCNRLSGDYQTRGGELHLGPLAATRMACPPDMLDVENRLLKALAGVVAYRVTGPQLELSGADKQVLATFSRE